jgi:hypothetical protein
VQLTAPRRVPELAAQAMVSLMDFHSGKVNSEKVAAIRNSLFDALRTDLDDEARRTN